MTRERKLPRRLVGMVGVFAVVVLSIFPQASAQANEEETDEAKLLVLQTISLIANGREQDVVEERLTDALEAPDQSGVDVTKVQEAADLLTAGPVDDSVMEEVRGLLEGAIEIRAATGYGSMPAPGEVGTDTAPYAAGAETATVVVLDELNPAGGIGDATDAVLLVIALVLIALGLFLARRWRPRHSIHDLRTVRLETDSD